MKKILLGLFLILGAISFALPKYVVKNDLSKTELNKVSDSLLNEVESFIK